MKRDSPDRITPAHIFLNRRRLLYQLGLGGFAMSAGLGTGYKTQGLGEPGESAFSPGSETSYGIPSSVERQSITPREVAAVHNNYYELQPGRGGDLRHLIADLVVEPWSLEVDGACDRPARFDLEDLRGFEQQERLYHFRCVERWAMNVPWTGFALKELLNQVEPRQEAAWVVFESALQESAMPGVGATSYYPWPYREALRLDEAMHDLTLLATGIYGHPLPKQHGAPIRLVVPWKYGYKSAKALVRITLVEERPKTFWSTISPHEYGLLSNVNPNIPHSRWSQENSFWLRDDPTWPTGEDVFPTQLFNGYGDQVASMYPDEPTEPQMVLKPGQIAR